MLETGRTHQVRVHFASIGNPLLGDAVYGKRSPLLARQFLHAHILGFKHPATGEWMEFTSPLPPDLQATLNVIESSER
jgi:23S rRNA pseudouridine1911/1915/1917 synthase